MNKFYVFSSELLDEPSEENSTFQVSVYLSGAVDRRIAELEAQLAAERERCAMICDEIGAADNGCGCAAAIHKGG